MKILCFFGFHKNKLVFKHLGDCKGEFICKRVGCWNVIFRDPREAASYNK